MNMVKRPILVYDFKAFGTAIKPARKKYGKSRKKVSNEPFILALSCKNWEQRTAVNQQIFYDLVTRYYISEERYFFPNDTADKSMQW